MVSPFCGAVVQTGISSIKNILASAARNVAIQLIDILKLPVIKSSSVNCGNCCNGAIR